MQLTSPGNFNMFGCFQSYIVISCFLNSIYELHYIIKWYSSSRLTQYTYTLIYRGTSMLIPSSSFGTKSV